MKQLGEFLVGSIQLGSRMFVVCSFFLITRNVKNSFQFIILLLLDTMYLYMCTIISGFQLILNSANLYFLIGEFNPFMARMLLINLFLSF